MATREKGKGLTRAYSSQAELKYTGIRWGMSSNLFLDETFDKAMKMHLLPQYRNEAETEATLKLTGFIDALRRNRKWTATREDYLRWFALSERERWDRKYPLTRGEAVTRFVTGKQPQPIANMRPFYFSAKPDSPYRPRKGSSTGKVFTKQIGARRVQKDFDNLMKTIFSLQDAFNKGKKTKMPKINISRTFTKY